MSRSSFEKLLGFVVIVSAIMFVLYAVKFTTMGNKIETYKIKAAFNSSGDLKIGSEVKLAGVKIGKVESITLDYENYRALIVMNIDKNVALPIDTIASIVSNGFIGSKFVRLNVGVDKTTLKANEILSETTEVETLEQMLGRIIYLVTE